MSFDLPAQPLMDSLRSLASQSNLNVFFEPKNVVGMHAPALKATLTTKEALEHLLKNSGLTYRSIDERTLSVVSADSISQTSMSTDRSRTMPVRLAQAENSSRAAPAGRAAEAEASPLQANLEEIVVTAQKREEKLQDVPISISVLSGAELDSSTAQGLLREQLNSVAGVTVHTDQNGSPGFVVRGVSTTFRFGGSSGVGYYLDTVPFGLVRSAILPDANVYDLERVEVLKGPQGTLYGAGSLNGVVRILTKDPDLDQIDFKVRSSASTTQGGDDGYRGDMAVNLPIVSGKLGARAVAGYQRLGGWVDKPATNETDANDEESSNIRLKIDGQPTDKLSIGASLWRSRIDRGGLSIADVNAQSRARFPEVSADDFDTYGLEVGYELPRASLTSMTSYVRANVISNSDVTPYGVPSLLSTDIDSKVLSQEIIVASTAATSWEWSIGGMYRDAEDSMIQTLPQSAAILNIQTDTSKSIAVYGELTRLLFGGRLELTGGLRYFEDEVGADVRPRFAGDTTYDNIAEFDKVSSRIVLTWHASENLTTYASYSQGFRSGIQQNASVLRRFAAGGVAPVTQPDTLTNYELGAKGSLWNGNFDFDAALYYIQWKDRPLGRVVTVSAGSATFQTNALINSEPLSGPGFDLGVSARPMNGLTLRAGASWNDLTFEQDTFDAGVLIAGKGMRDSLSAEWTVGMSAEYVFPFFAGFEGRLSGSANHVSAELPGLQAVAPEGSDAQWISRASFALVAPHHWTATLFVDNANNWNGKLVPLNPPVLSSRDYMVVRARPRTIGLQFEYRL